MACKFAKGAKLPLPLETKNGLSINFHKPKFFESQKEKKFCYKVAHVYALNF